MSESQKSMGKSSKKNNASLSTSEHRLPLAEDFDHTLNMMIIAPWKRAILNYCSERGLNWASSYSTVRYTHSQLTGFAFKFN